MPTQIDSVSNDARREDGGSKPKPVGVRRIASDTDDADGISRRTVLRGTGFAVAGGSLLAGATEKGRASGGRDDGLNVRTTNVEVLDGGENAKTETKGRVSGMSNYDCKRCEIGAEVQPVGDDEWYGGVRTVDHVPYDSITVAVTLAGLHPGRYRCRLCACPITRDHLTYGNVVVIVVKDDDDDEHDGHHHGKSKLRAAYGKTCPCRLHHPGYNHVMVCGGGGRTIFEYEFAVASRHARRCSVSAAPSVIDDHHVTIDGEDFVRGELVTGAVAGGGDSYLFRGPLTDLRAEGGASVYVNGVEVR